MTALIVNTERRESDALFGHMDRSEVQKITRNGMSPDPGYLLIKESL